VRGRIIERIGSGELTPVMILIRSSFQTKYSGLLEVSIGHALVEGLPYPWFR